MELCGRYGVEFVKLKDMLDCGSYTKDWKVGFGGEIPGPPKLHHDDYDKST